MVHINISGTYRYIEENTIKTQSHKDPKEGCKPWSIPLPKLQNEMYNEVLAIPNVQP